MDTVQESLLGTLQDGYYEVDLKGDLTYCNAALAHIFGRDEEDLSGLSYRDYAHPDYADQVFEVFNQVYETGIPRERFYYRIYRPDGTLRSAQYSVHLMRDELGEPTGFRGIVRDVTEEEQERRTAETLRSVGELVAGTLELEEVLKRCCDAVVRESVGDRASIFLFDAEHAVALPVMSRGLRDPDLWERFSNQEELRVASNPGIARAMLDNQPLVIENAADSEMLDSFFVETFGVKSLVLYPLVSRGDPVGFFAVDSFREKVRFPESEIDLMHQIGHHVAGAIHQAQLYDEKRAEADRFRLITSAIHDLVVVFTSSNEVEYVSPSFVRTTGFDVDVLKTVKLVDRVHEDDRDEVVRWIREHVLASPGAADNRLIQFRLRCASEREVWLETTGNSVPPDNGGVTRAVLSGRVIDERKRLEAEMEKLAFYDPVTGLPNRSLFLDRLEQALERSRRTRCPVGLGFIDLDRFKEINDTLGHTMGDRVLQAVATRLEGLSRDADTLARFGGDEFVLLVENVASAAEVKKVVERLLEGMSQPLCFDDREIIMPASIGVTTGYPDALHADTLLSVADKAMYEAKKAGGARVVELES